MVKRERDGLAGGLLGTGGNTQQVGYDSSLTPSVHSSPEASLLLDPLGQPWFSLSDPLSPAPLGHRDHVYPTNDSTESPLLGGKTLNQLTASAGCLDLAHVSPDQYHGRAGTSSLAPRSLCAPGVTPCPAPVPGPLISPHAWLRLFLKGVEVEEVSDTERHFGQ